jgi:hypothetical protein
MKIFSLQSKTGLSIWVLILALVLNVVTFLNTKTPVYFKDGMFGTSILGFSYGWPLSYLQMEAGSPLLTKEFVIDLCFWSVLVLIILSIIRYFRNKKA